MFFLSFPGPLSPANIARADQPKEHEDVQCWHSRHWGPAEEVTWIPGGLNVSFIQEGTLQMLSSNLK